MNNVILTGRMTKDPEVRVITGSQTAVCSFALAVDRPVKKDAEKKTDFPRITVFGKQAENLEKYVGKGCRLMVQGRIQTGSYQDKNGQNVYTTDVIAERVEFIDFKDKNSQSKPQDTQEDYDIPDGFQSVSDDDIPF